MLTKIAKKLNRFAKDENGASAIEYAVIAALVAVILLLAFGATGVDLGAIFTDIGTSVNP